MAIMSGIVAGPTKSEPEADPDYISRRIQALVLATLSIKNINVDVIENFHNSTSDINKDAKTEKDQVALINITAEFEHLFEINSDLTPQSLKTLRQVRQITYRQMLIVQGSVDGNVDPDRMERITSREVEAGRMAPDDDFRQLAVASSLVMGKPKAAAMHLTWQQFFWGLLLLARGWIVQSFRRLTTMPK